MVPGVAGVAGLHGPEDFSPLAAAAVVESNRLRKAVRLASDLFLFFWLIGPVA